MNQPKDPRKSISATLPWAVTHGAESSVITAFPDATGTRATVAEIQAIGPCPARTIADYITTAVNLHAQRQTIIYGLVSALEECLETEKLGWSAEHDAELALERARAVGLTSDRPELE
jgi:hypothetical protein